LLTKRGRASEACGFSRSVRKASRKFPQPFRFSKSKVPGIFFVTPRANGKIIAAESTLARVTTRTAAGASRCVMVERKRRGNLPALGHARSNNMTRAAVEFFCRVVIRVSEADSISRGLSCRSGIAAELMARAARGNIAAARLRFRAMALVTRDVRAEAGRNRHRHPAAAWSMTRRATNPAQARVTRMIETHVEAAERRKRFECT
jgi:hypothetical protein